MRREIRAGRLDVPRFLPRRPDGPRYAVLSVVGAGFTYASGTRNRTTDEVTSSHSEGGNFSDTTFYLIDEDADQILKRAGVEPGMLGSRFAITNSSRRWIPGSRGPPARRRRRGAGDPVMLSD